MSANTATAGDFRRPPIERRDISFELSEDIPRHWHGGDPFITTYFNGLSIMFPEGEQFFIDSVRHYRDRITDPELKEQIRGFIGQEAMHSREHLRYNELLDQQGYPANRLHEKLKGILKFVRRRTNPKQQLAATCALEHFTAILADVALRDRRVYAGVHPVFRDLWRWHAIEETEHKAVAYDVYQSLFPGFLGYLTRIHAMFRTTILFIWRSGSHHVALLRADGQLWNLRGWARAFRWFWVRPGVFRQILPAYFSYYRPGYHPWDHDNSDLVDYWKKTLENKGYGTLHQHDEDEAVA